MVFATSAPKKGMAMKKQNVVKRNISVPPDLFEEIKRIADVECRGNVSRVITDLLKSQMISLGYVAGNPLSSEDYPSSPCPECAKKDAVIAEQRTIILALAGRPLGTTAPGAATGGESGSAVHRRGA